MVNEIIKIMWIKSQLDNSFNMNLKRKNIKIHQKMILWIFENKVILTHLKVHIFFWVKVFLTIFLHLY
jgi:hypothetical protein